MADLRLFPFEEYLDGIFSPETIARLDSALAEYHRTDPAGLATTLSRMGGCQPLEFYEAITCTTLRTLDLLVPIYNLGGGMTRDEVRSLGNALYGTAIGAWAQRAHVKSVVEALK